MFFIKLWVSLYIISFIVMLVNAIDAYVFDSELLDKYEVIVTPIFYFFLFSSVMFGAIWFGLLVYGLWTI